MWAWSNGGMKIRMGKQDSEETLLRYHFVQREPQLKSRDTYPEALGQNERAKQTLGYRQRSWPEISSACPLLTILRNVSLPLVDDTEKCSILTLQNSRLPALNSYNSIL
jgi:hypothetical protein